jgi:hypothetical protein
MLQIKVINFKLLQINVFLLVLFFLSYNSIQSQNRAQIQVNGMESSPLNYAWAGGLNSVQFGSIDINLDGLNDLFAFDRNGNRKLCFINNGVYNSIDFSYQPQYEKLFPDLYDWAVFADYDGDGRTDIFTYSPGWAGMIVYRNVSVDLLKFELVVSPYLETFQENGYVNLLVTDVDYPGIADLDGDGDLDILAFWGLGTFVNYNRNMSMEKYGNADSLDFLLEEYCWGFFAESEESNQIFLDTCFLHKNSSQSPVDKERHRGSTFLLLDLNNDTVLDVLLGDVDYPELYALENGGTQDFALITDFDTTFPQSSTEISLFDFPVTAYIDVNNDNKKDLLVSPFDPRLETAQNKKSVWLYLNTGSDDDPFFVLETKDFLQSKMIDRGSGAYPVLFDWDGDGLLDLFVGNYGFYKSSYYEFMDLVSVYRSRIGYYKNTGTAQNPVFQLWDDDFANLSELNKVALLPTFYDLDGDGKSDLLVGDSIGNLIFVKNLGGEEFEVVTEKFDDINVGFFSSPQLFDLDKDGLSDLIIGEQNGNINYYRNEGTMQNPNFTFVTDSLGKINVTNYNTSWFGFSTPSFFRLEDGITRLVVGSESGEIFYYTNIDGNLDGAFTKSDLLDELLDTTGISADRGIRTGAFVADINSDGKTEMIVGNYSGGLEYFNGNAQVLPGIFDISETKRNLQLFPNPAQNNVNLQFSEQQKISSLTITDLQGRIVLTKGMTQKPVRHCTLNTSTLGNGMYLVTAKTETGLIVEKLSIQR